MGEGAKLSLRTKAIFASVLICIAGAWLWWQIDAAKERQQKREQAEAAEIANFDRITTASEASTREFETIVNYYNSSAFLSIYENREGMEPILKRVDRYLKSSFQSSKPLPSGILTKILDDECWGYSYAYEVAKEPGRAERLQKYQDLYQYLYRSYAPHVSSLSEHEARCKSYVEKAMVKYAENQKSAGEKLGELYGKVSEGASDAYTEATKPLSDFYADFQKGIDSAKQ